ncbi:MULTISPECIES: MerR family transcriptional regulator [Streptomyces]|uniref:Transcriptional regulator n=1 Tax=Streptomyces atratus TaxID=1893 RepID=A0A2Z5JKN5_STRAR|nr:MULTISPECIES: MerR family transcriptional regulator [Streptomyces]AXE80988.1 transcriptional regulator [Streptomyces atratus]MEE1809242.1 MerR family transcriptional regulator [Streptomyces sp. BE133]WPW32152.1 MerR family transcriptional regulator [Streptomyces atratus]GGT20312.1 transcriptional regulator [Streptomyces atratus]
MKVSDLSRLTGTPVGTIKYYLREGLLPPGRALGATLTMYGDEHIQRLRLIRALTARGGLSIAATRDVLAAIDQPLDPLATLGVVHYALPTPVDAAETDAVGEQAPQVDQLLGAMGWDISEESPHRRALAASLMDLSRLGMEYSTEDLLPYAELAAAAARLDLDRLEDIEDRLRLAEHAAIVVLLLEPVLAILRRLAQEDESRHRTAWARTTDGAGPRSTTRPVDHPRESH